MVSAFAVKSFPRLLGVILKSDVASPSTVAAATETSWGAGAFRLTVKFRAVSVPSVAEASAMEKVRSLS